MQLSLKHVLTDVFCVLTESLIKWRYMHAERNETCLPVVWLSAGNVDEKIYNKVDK